MGRPQRVIRDQMSIKATALPSCEVTKNRKNVLEFIVKHGAFIRATIRCQGVSENLVDDLFQDFFLALMAKPIPQDVQNVRGYIYRAISNDTIDAIRRVENYRKHLGRYTKFLNYSDNCQTPQNNIMKTEDTQKVQVAIEKHLRGRTAEALTMRYSEGRSIQYIAHKMNVDKRSVSRYLTKGLSQIRKYLRER